MANKEHSVKTTSKGIERRLAGWGVFFMILGVLGLIGGILTALSEQPIGLLIGIVAFLQMMMVRVLFDGAADAIRLLKMENNLPYNGMISGIVNTYKCSACGHKISKYDKKCPNCGEVFE